MEELKIIVELLKTNSISTLLGAYVIWKDLVHPRIKKNKGTFVSYKDLETRISEIGMKTAAIDNKLEHHLEKEAEEDVKMGVMENNILHLQENQNKTDANMEKVFNMISHLKDSMIEMGYGKK